MKQDIIERILKETGATAISDIQLIQKLWNNYGELSRIYLEGGTRASVILKHAKIPDELFHPKGFHNEISQARKIKSYQVETSWYQNFNQDNNLDNGRDTASRTAECLGAFQTEGEFFILLEDLDLAGFDLRLGQVSMAQIKMVLKWLANFHARFLNTQPQDLWSTGTYWHLATRPDELAATADLFIKDMAPLIDKTLENCRYKTIVHGDAKLANFCFSKHNQVAAVDFQYTGGGCGMKDVAYFIGSCMNEKQSEEYEDVILDYYFEQFELAAKFHKRPEQEIQACIEEWRQLYPVAWADFHRFLKGWSPQHWKINTYSEKVTARVCHQILEKLSAQAQLAAKKAGEVILAFYQKDFQTHQKEGNSLATSIVTEVDIKAQKVVIENLKQSIHFFDLGLLAEESEQDRSRLEKCFFWAIDPMDGTLYFSKGEPGFAVSIALVSQSGKSYVGVVFDPVRGELFHATKNGGAYLNSSPLAKNTKTHNCDKPHLYVDLSMQKVPQFKSLEESYHLIFQSGAVLNTLNAVRTVNALYFKYPKKSEGGCAIWDIAATLLIIQEIGGTFESFTGEALDLNKPQSIFYNNEGLYVSALARNNFSIP